MLLAIVTVSQASAQRVYGQTSTDNLNVRKTPDGEVIDKLGKGALVLITRVKGKWANVGYLGPDGKLKTGWVASNYLRLVRRGDGYSSDTYTTARGAEFTVSVSDTDLYCREGFDGGYSGCEVEIEFEINTNYNGNDDPSVDVTCEAEVSYTDTSGWSSSKSDSVSENVYVYSAYESGSVDVDFSFSFDEATRVRLRDASCRIDGVY